jgi:hypothetical protein
MHVLAGVCSAFCQAQMLAVHIAVNDDRMQALAVHVAVNDDRMQVT